MSEKNDLQELCQKKKWGMPLYDSIHNPDSPHHQPEWNSTVIIIADGQKIIIDTIVSASTKISAEKQVAGLMLAYLEAEFFHKPSMLKKLSDTTKLNITSTHRGTLSDREISSDIVLLSEGSSDEAIVECIYLIDLENKPCFKHGYRKNAIYVGFINSIHHSISKYDEWHACESDDIEIEMNHSSNHKLLYAVEGGTADLADHFMTMFIYPLMYYLKKIGYNPKICIVSGDHAGWCTRICLEKVLKWNKMADIEVCNRTTL